MKKLSLVAVLAVLGLILAGCGPIATKVTKVVGNDLARTSELAQKYNKPEVKQCSDYLIVAINDISAVDEKLAALQAEQTSGLISLSFKNILIAELLREQASEANKEKFEKGFDEACGQVAGEIMLNLVRDAAKVAKKSAPVVIPVP